MSKVRQNQKPKSQGFGLWTLDFGLHPNTAMRVTANTFSDSLIDQLNALSTRQQRLQNQATTGQRIQLPEDDPAAMERVLNLQTEGKAVAQFKSNIAHLTDMAQASYGVMTGLKKISDRAGELATLADGTKSPADLKLYATELTQLIKQAVQVTQSKFQGNYLLSGTRSDQPPFALGMDANGNVTTNRLDGELLDVAGSGSNVRLAESDHMYDSMDRRISSLFCTQ